MSAFKTAGAHVAGRSHERNNTVCQDRTYELVAGGFGGVALADGAGSYPSSHLGAAYITEKILYYIKSRFAYLQRLKNPQKHLLNFLEVSIHNAAREYNMAPEELSSTLLFAVAKNGRYLAGHIGDGVIGVLKDGTVQTLSEPHTGEASNQTYFVTTFGYPQRLRIYRGTFETLEGFILFSDGVEASMYRKHTRQIAPAAATVIQWLHHNNPSDVSTALLTNLNQIIKQKTHDDCSIALLCESGIS